MRVTFIPYTHRIYSHILADEYPSLKIIASGDRPRFPHLGYFGNIVNRLCFPCLKRGLSPNSPRSGGSPTSPDAEKTGSQPAGVAGIRERGEGIRIHIAGTARSYLLPVDRVCR